jgi:predicted transcriptional regulator
MKIYELIKITDGHVVSGQDALDRDVNHAFASDLLSDVLTVNRAGIMLITGVANLQTIRTAEMAEVSCILLVRRKKASTEMISLARENGVVLVECPGSMFGVSGRLYEAGIKPVY